jgi:hypothetical protein
MNILKVIVTLLFLGCANWKNGVGGRLAIIPGYKNCYIYFFFFRAKCRHTSFSALL